MWTLQTDTASASWVTNGHREQMRSIQADARFSETERERGNGLTGTL